MKGTKDLNGMKMRGTEMNALKRGGGRVGQKEGRSGQAVEEGGGGVWV